ncbi:MAG: hypothetical protein PHQ80_02235 [Candidatus ainarchaeum sp.]|nr:hypothetical protein [Candidatus ainarchaeum sp.]MDD5096494.1 hypothetical protein [Candidatus ainarchaeum sp.]
MAIELAAMYPLSVFALGITMIVIGLAYALSQLLQNPAFLVWCKTEFFEVFVSLGIVLVTLFMIGFITNDVKYGAFVSLLPSGIAAPSYSNPEIGDGDTVFNASSKYLTNVAYFVHTSMEGSRAAYGALEVHMRYRRMPCLPGILMCIFGPSGFNFAPESGGGAWIQAMNMTMYTDTAAYITVLVQLAFLSFIQSGGFLLFLPLAIVFRSLPFMRQLGGGLMAMCIALFIIYPSLLFLESFFWDPSAMVGASEIESVESAISGMAGAGGAGVGMFSNSLPDDLDGNVWNEGTSLNDFVGYREVVDNAVRPLLKIAAVSFLSSTFLFALNIIAVSASARELGRLFGQEVDLSRLMHIV